MRWQKRARIGLAIFGITFAVVVFFAVQKRQQTDVVTAVARTDPAAIMEMSKCEMQRVTGTRKDFTLRCERYLQYENDTGRLFKPQIEVKERQGRDFVISGSEALINFKSREINFTTQVILRASDGFELTTAAATFNENDGIVRAPGALSFKKGGMSGTGVGMTYDKNTDVLTVLDQSHVRMTDQGGNTTAEFAAGTATLDRPQNFLALERAVHVLRGEQTIDTDRGTARLTDNDETITAIALRGNSRVAGGASAFDAMSARDIDIDYADDGSTIERVVLSGTGAIVLKGTGGAPGRQILGDSLAVDVAADGSVTSVVARERAQLDLPADGTTAARQVRARNLDASGEAGKGMTSAQFSEDVEYHEAGTPAKARTARSRLLTVALDESAITSALFTGRVQFEEGGLKASAAEARYDPARGVLRLTGADDGGGPRVADEQIAIEAGAIEVTLAGRTMVADGTVKTQLQSSAKTPGLLNREQPTNISASHLEYQGDAGAAAYTGTAQLWQGETAIRGESIVIDQEKGSLRAIGTASSTLTLSDKPSVGRAHEITYENATRQVTFVGRPAPVPVPGAPRPPATPNASAPPSATSKPGPATAPVAATVAGATAARPAGPPVSAGVPAHVSGPEGDLQAARIVAQLHPQENRLERLEGYDDVTLRTDRRVVTGARMTYYSNGRYEMSGTPTVPVKIVEGCRETIGRTLTFFKSTDNIVIDGNEEIRTRTTSAGPCPQSQ